MTTPLTDKVKTVPADDLRAALARDPLAFSQKLVSEFGHEPTVDKLRDLMGDEKANGLITNIGVAALHSAPSGLNLSLGSIVANTLGRLTQQDLAGIARGDSYAMNRAQSIAEEQVKAVQASQPARTDREFGAAGPDGGAFGSFDRLAALRGAGRDGSAPSSYSRQAAGTGQENGGYANPSFLKSVGLSTATASTLAQMGFTSQAQIKALTNDADRIGVEKNKGSVALGMMKSDDPDNYNSHVHFFANDYKQGLEEIEQMNDAIAREKDPAKKAALTKQRDEKSAGLEEHRQQQRERSREHDKSQKGFDDMSTLSKNAVRLKHKHGADASRNLSRGDTRAELSDNELRKGDKAAAGKRVEAAAVSDEAAFANFASLNQDMFNAPAQRAPKPEPVKTAENKTEAAPSNKPADAAIKGDKDSSQPKPVRSAETKVGASRPASSPSLA